MSDNGTKPDARRKYGIQRTLTSARNVAACYAGSVVEGFVFLLLTPFLLRRLGIALFGLWCLAAALAEILQMLDLGLREAVTKFTAGHQARSDVGEVRRLADTSLLLYLILALAALATLSAIVWFGLPAMVDEADLATARSVLLVLGLLSIVSLPGGIAASVLEGLARFDLINLFRVGWAALRLALIVLALQLEFGLPGVAVAEFAARFLLIVVRWIALARIEPALLPTPRFYRDVFRNLVGFGAWNAVRYGAEIATFRLCEPLLALFTGPAGVGAFVAGRRLAMIPAEMISPMTGVVFPLTSEMDANGRGPALRQTLVKATKVAFFVSFPISLAMALGAGPIQANWLGGRAPEVEPVLAIFALVFLLVAGCLPAEVVLLGLGRTRFLAFCGLAQLAITLGLGAILANRYGAPGLAAAALVAVVTVPVLLQMPVAAHHCGVSLLHLFRRAVVPLILAGAPVAIAMLVLRDPIAVGGLAGLGVWAGGAAVTFALIYWWIGTDAEERVFFRQHLTRLLKPSTVTDWSDPP